MPPTKRARVLGFSNVAVLADVLAQHVLSGGRTAGGGLCDLHSYTELALTGTPCGASLAALAPLLARLVTVAPGASINQKALEKALGQVARQFSGLQPSALSEAQWATHLAQQLRCAVSHCRRLKLNRTLCRQRLRGLTAAQQEAVQAVLDLIVIEDGEGSEAEAAAEFADSAVAAVAVSEASAPVEALVDTSGTPRRRLARKCSGLSDLDFDALAGSPDPAEPVRMTPAQCGLLLDALAALPRPPGQGAQAVATAATKASLRRPAATVKNCARKVARGKPAVARKTGAEHTGKRFLKMYYKASGAVAVREAGGGQVLQVAVRGASREALSAVADECIEKLCNGVSLVAVKQWLVEAKARVTEALAPNVD